MKMSQIEMFIYAVNTGSIAEAARKLEKSRTTVSAALSALEDDLGVQLLTRSGNRITPTEMGQAIVNDCERITLIANDIIAKCEQHRDGVESMLRIVRDDSLPEELWRDLIRQMNTLFPKTSISIYISPTPEIVNMVEENLVDVAYGLLPSHQDSPRLYYSDLGQIRMMSVAHADHPLCKLQKVTSGDLERFKEVVIAYIDDDGLRAAASHSSNYLGLTFYEHLRDAVLDKAGWSYVPALLIQDYLRQGTLKMLKHNRAMNWQSYGEIVESESRRGAVVQWLSNQIANYLLDVSG